MTSRVHSRWQQATEAHHSGTSNDSPIDLSKPDAEAAVLAEKLQAVQTQMTFTRVVLFIGKWIIRPVFLWPFKYYFKAVFWVFKRSNTKERQYVYRTRPDGESERVYF